MPIVELFSTRQKRLRGEMPDVYVYDEIPKPLRIQIIHIIRDTIGVDHKDYIGTDPRRSHYSSIDETISDIYKSIDKTLCKEYGVLTLNGEEHVSNYGNAVLDYFLKCNNHEHCLDIVELVFSLIETFIVKIGRHAVLSKKSSQTLEDAIAELNKRFKETGVGYEFNAGKLMRIDSQLVHSEVIQPVLTLLQGNEIYKGANEEFLTAHDHYRHKRYKECLVEALKSIESLIKGICTQQKWEFNENDAAKKLINICLDQKLIPDYLQSHFSSLRTLLESGVPTIRNKEGGHGQGSEVTDVHDYLASYALHLTASNLLFLMQSHEQLINKDSRR